MEVSSQLNAPAALPPGILSNVVFILRLTGRCGAWIFLPLRDTGLAFFLCCWILHYDLWAGRAIAQADSRWLPTAAARV
jgi:hypothetical protein